MTPAKGATHTAASMKSKPGGSSPEPEAPKAMNRDEHAWGSFVANNLLLPALAVFTGLVVGGVIIAVSNEAAIAAWGRFFQNPWAALAASWSAVVQAYGALFSGALGKPADVIAGFQTFFATGDKQALYKAIYPFTESSRSLDTLYLHGPVGCSRIPVRAVQHWCRGSVLHGRPGRCIHRLQY